MAGRVKREVQETTETVEIPIPMSAQELASASVEFVTASKEVDEHVDEKRQFLSLWREHHKAKKEEHDRLRSILAAGAAPKKVKCLVQRDYGEDEVRYIGLGTGKKLHSRPMNADDRQLRVPGTGEPSDGPPSDKPPKGEEGKPLVGKAKKPDVEKTIGRRKSKGTEDTFPPARPPAEF